MRIYWIDLENAPGQLGMMARPKGHDWLQSEIKQLSDSGVNILISLLEAREERELGLTEELLLSQKAGIDFVRFPIADRGVPDSKKRFIELTKTIVASIRNGEKVVVHCRMGIGRTAMLCAAILLVLGEAPDSVFERLSNYRTVKVPDTNAQKIWVLEHYAKPLS